MSEHSTDTHGSDIGRVLPGTALPPDVPLTQANVTSFEVMTDAEARRRIEEIERSKSPMLDFEEFEDSPPSTPPRSGAVSAATLAWDPYDSRLAPTSPDQENPALGIRPRSSTPPVPAWLREGDEVVIVDGSDEAQRTASPDFTSRLRSSSPNFFATSTPLKGISPGRPKPGAFHLRSALKIRRSKIAPAIAPSPLVLANAGSNEEAVERPLYSQVHRQARPAPHVQVIQVRPAEATDGGDSASPSLPQKTSSSRILEETLASIPRPDGPPPASGHQMGRDLGKAKDRSRSAGDVSASSDQLNDTSPYAEVQTSQAVHVGRRHSEMPRVSTPPTRRDSLPVPVTAKSVTFRHAAGNDYLLAADSSADLGPEQEADCSEGMDETDWIEDPTHLTPLHYAASLGKRRYLTLLLKQMKRGVVGERTLSRLDDMQETTMMRTTNVSSMTDIDCYDGYRRTALMHAVHSGHSDCARLLLHEGATVDSRSSDGSTALHVACFDGDANMVSLLLHHGADPSLTDSAGRLPLHWATAPYGRQCIHVLMKKVSDMNINALDSSSMTPLMWAAYHDSPDVIEELLRQGAERSLHDEDGMTACHWAMHPQHNDALKLLLDTNSVRVRDARGKTLAHMAAEHGAVECMQLVLLTWPQSIHQCDDNGRTPLHWATVCEQPNIIRVLLVAGADPSAPDRLGRSPRDYAAIKKLRYCQVLLSRPKFAASHEMSIAQLDASISGEFNQRWSQWLSDGCTLGKYTHDGRGPLHKRYFWVDIPHSEICWSKDKKKQKEYSSATVVDIVPGASDSVLSRIDYNDRKRHHFTVLTTDRSLDLVASNADDLQCWLQGLRCLIQMKAATTEGFPAQ